MAQDNPSPEEQLLKLIENPTTDPKKDGAASGIKLAEKKTRAPWSAGKFFGFLAFLKHQKKEKAAVNVAAAPKIFAVRKINTFLIAGVVAALLYLVLDVTILKGDARDFLGQVSLQEAIYPVRTKGADLAQRDVAYYHQMVDRRNPFMSAGEQPKVEDTPAPVVLEQPQSEKMQKVLQSIKLVGISWTEGSPLAMIEEVESGRTFFLREGQEIKGLKVQKIDKEKVAVTYEGEESLLF